MLYLSGLSITKCTLIQKTTSTSYYDTMKVNSGNECLPFGYMEMFVHTKLFDKVNISLFIFDVDEIKLFVSDVAGDIKFGIF